MKPPIDEARRRALVAQQRRALRALTDAARDPLDASQALDGEPVQAFTDPSDVRRTSKTFPTNPLAKRGRPGALSTAGPSESLSDGQDHPIGTKVSRLSYARKRLVWRSVTEGNPPRDASTGPASVPPSDGRPSNVYALDDGRPLDIDGSDWTVRLIRDTSNQRVLGNLANVVMILKNDPTWQDAFWWDEFTDSIAVRKPIPFPVPGRWNDSHEKQLTVWLQEHKTYKMVGSTNVTKETVRDALQCIVENKRFHSVATEYNALSWDCVPRLDRWLIDYAGAKDSTFARLVGPKFLLSLVARQFDPGCKVDTVLVFEGKQGNKKSSVCRALAGPGRFFDDTIKLESRDTAQVLRGKTIVEFQELSRFTRDPKANEVFKVFVRKREDEHVHKWERHARVSKRSWVGMATTNPDAYLSDETGTRTVWPIPLDDRVSIGPIERDCNQLLAEAVVRYKWYVFLKSQLPPGGDVDDLPTEIRWWLIGDEETLAKEEQAKRYEVGVWDSHIRQMMANADSLSVDEILESIHARSAPSGSRARALAAERTGDATVHEGTRELRSKEKWSVGQKREVVKTLLHVGWIRRRMGTRNSREWRYWRPGVWRALEDRQDTSKRVSAMEILYVEPTSESAAESDVEEMPLEPNSSEDE